MYTVSEDFGGFAAGFPHPWIRFVPLFPPRFFCSWVTAWVKTLSRWAGTDRILVEEFNDNWDKIDTALKSSADGVAALQTALASCGNCKIVYGTYTGNGKSGSANPNKLTFDGKPVLVIVQEEKQTADMDINLRMLRPCTWAQGAATNDNWVNAVTWGAAQVQWYSRNDYAPTQFNETGKKYYYLALIDAAV